MFGFSMSTVVFWFVLPLVLLLFALNDLLTRRFSDSGTKVVWALVVLFIPLLGPVIYLGMGRKQGTRQAA